jgi:hypothetical protein
VDDDDRDDRRRKRSVGLHGGARLSAGPDTRPSHVDEGFPAPRAA